jgi:hypothetical protein
MGNCCSVVGDEDEGRKRGTLMGMMDVIRRRAMTTHDIISASKDLGLWYKPGADQSFKLSLIIGAIICSLITIQTDKLSTFIF